MIRVHDALHEQLACLRMKFQWQERDGILTTYIKHLNPTVPEAKLLPELFRNTSLLIPWSLLLLLKVI